MAPSEAGAAAAAAVGLGHGSSASGEKDTDGQGSEASSSVSGTWNTAQEVLLKAISERANCMRWLHNQCYIHFESMNFYFTIPNVVITTLNGSVTMSLTALFPDPDTQKVATTIIGLVSIFSAVLTTMNQYIKSQQMMEAHRSAGLAYGKLHRMIMNELALRRDQRQNALEFLKLVRAEQDRLENTAPTILPKIILKFNVQFADRNIEKPEIAGDLDEVEINNASRRRRLVLNRQHNEEDGEASVIYSAGKTLRRLGADIGAFTQGVIRKVHSHSDMSASRSDRGSPAGVPPSPVARPAVPGSVLRNRIETVRESKEEDEQPEIIQIKS